MKKRSLLIKPASSTCNMKCTYCFYHDVSSEREVRSYGTMKRQTVEAMINSIYEELADGDELSLAFQGGEPTLAGLDFFVDFVGYINEQPKKVYVSYAIQTNGTLIDEAFAHFFKAHDFLVGLSIDGNKSLHDGNRIFNDNSPTFNQVMKAKRLFDKVGVAYNVLMVLTGKMARQPKKVWQFLLKENIKFVQFIPCLDELSANEKSPFALTPLAFFNFYDDLFKGWLAAFAQGNYISIKFFDDTIYLLGTGRPAACGQLGKCANQLVVEADGSVYPCDFYVLDDYKIGNISEDPLSAIEQHPNLATFFEEDNKSDEVFCKRCAYYQMCYGGCKRMKTTVYVDVKMQKCGYQLFLNEHIDVLKRLAMNEYGRSTR